MTNIFFIFASMNLFIAIIQYVILTIIIVPLWVITCIAGFIVSVMLYFLFSYKLNAKKMYAYNSSSETLMVAEEKVNYLKRIKNRFKSKSVL